MTQSSDADVFVRLCAAGVLLLGVGQAVYAGVAGIVYASVFLLDPTVPFVATLPPGIMALSLYVGVALLGAAGCLATFVGLVLRAPWGWALAIVVGLVYAPVGIGLVVLGAAIAGREPFLEQLQQVEASEAPA